MITHLEPEILEPEVEWALGSITAKQASRFPAELFQVLKEAEDIKRWQDYIGEVYKKDLQDPDNHNGVITHLEPDILECEVKWALENITTFIFAFISNILGGGS